MASVSGSLHEQLMQWLALYVNHMQCGVRLSPHTTVGSGHWLGRARQSGHPSRSPDLSLVSSHLVR